jgi:nucleoid-associated protein YgaU
MAMREHATESLEPYESPEAEYDWDYDEEPARHDAPKVLWGRIAILGALVIVAFLIGRMTSDEGVPASDLAAAERQAENARAEVAALRERVTSLEDQLADAQAAEGETTTAPTDDGEEDEGTEPAAEGDVEMHTVAPGETLTTISEDYYDDAGYADYIAEYNGISDPTLISVGMELEIPPKPE